jgi:serine/threonine-protein kinase
MRIDPAAWPALSKLLDEWLDQPPESRAQWLDSLGPEHAETLPALRELIAARAAAGDDFLRTPPKLQPALRAAAAGFEAGGHVGPYRLIRELGHGGMGVVWLAERADGSLKRAFALKLPLFSVRNRALAERFARERDILAQLAHPRIAGLYDAGISEHGQPYLALEYIEGRKITEYCDERRLGLRARLALFLEVARAVQYAHANLVVHRDLKPANILVTNQGEVRLLDFGIAKLLTEGEAGETELTQLGGRAFTPQYASPEQISGGVLTTASDVYSLGVVLYELLTGARPYKLRRDTRGGLEEAIVEAEPVRPSQASIGVKRQSRALRGDLDTIVLKALAKRPADRYGSADALIQDIQRYLDGEAVLARPENPWYRARKFVLRNKLAVISGAAIVAALSVGLGIALWQAHIAQVQTRTSATVQAFLLDIFRANSIEHADPAKARQTTAAELLDIGAQRIGGALNDAPQAKLELLETLFRLYTDLGLQDKGVAVGRTRIALAKTFYGANHPEVARALVDLAADSGESSFAKDRAALLKEAGMILDRRRDLTSRTRALYYLGMGNISYDLDVTRSAQFAGKAIELYRHFPASRELVFALNLLGQRQGSQGQYREAIGNLTEAARLGGQLREARRALPAIYASLGESQRQILDFAGAETSFREALEVASATKGAESPDVIQTQWRLGNFLVQTSRPQEGLALIKQSLDLALRTLGPDETFHTPMVRRAYGVNLLRYGGAEQAAAALSQVVGFARRAGLSSILDFALSLEQSAPPEIELGHFQQAAALLDEALAIRTRLALKPDSRLWDDGRLARATLLIAMGKADDATKALEQIPEGAAPRAKITYAWLDVALARAEISLALDRPAAAIEQAGAVRVRIAESGAGAYFKRWDAQAACVGGKGLLASGRASDAAPLLERAVQLGLEVHDRDHSLRLADSEIALAQALLELGHGDQAAPHLARAKAIHATYKELGEQYRTPLRRLEARVRVTPREASLPRE